jgi:hypothetical protein
MATTSNPDPSAATGFSEEEKGELRQLIAEAIGSVTPPKAEPTSTAPAVTDDEWDKMTDRARESYVKNVVSDVLDSLRRDDEIARQGAEIDALKQKPEPEGTPQDSPPGLLQKIQKLVWGEQKP